MITKALLEELFEYEPLTGNLIRRTSRGGRKAGSVAGYLDAGYVKVEVNNEPIFAHRVAWCLYHGELPKGLIDHEDGDGTNNRILNLRDATCLQNQQNRRISKNNTSGVKGVYRYKRTGKWRAKFKLAGKCIQVGEFDKIEDAAEAIRKKRIELHREFSNHG